MTARFSLKAIILPLASIAALAGSSGFASAQQWQPWDGSRQPPQQYDNGYSDPQDDDRYFDRQDGPRADNRYGDPDSDPRRYDPRYNNNDGDGSRNNAAPRYPDAGQYPGPRADGRADDGELEYGDQRSGNSRNTEPRYSEPRYGDREDEGYGAWDAAPSREE